MERKRRQTGNKLDTTIHLTNNIIQFSNPENPKRAFSRLLYSLAHDKQMANELGSDNPIRPATMTRNRTRVRKELEKLIKTLNLVIRSGGESLINILNVRNDSARNIAKMIAKVWIFLLGKMLAIFTRTKPGSKTKADDWSPKNCGECDICVPKGPQPQCPLCNAELIGLMNYLKISAELIMTLPIDVMKSMAWAPIKHLLIGTMDRALAHLIYQGPEILTSLQIRTRKCLTKILSNTPNVHHTHGPQDKVPVKSKNRGRKRKRTQTSHGTSVKK